VVKPYKHLPSGKKEQVEQMFDKIAWRYDFLNHLLSWGIDKGWRRKVVKSLDSLNSGDTLIDVATGTGDLAIAMAQKLPVNVVGIDLSKAMLDQGIEKIKARKLNQQISLQKMDVESLTFADNYFSAATVAFGVRNFGNLHQGLQQMHRVIKPGGRIAVLEFSMPRNVVFRALYKFYAKFVLPMIGRLFSRESFAYSYLPDSVQAFPAYDEFVLRLKEAGFKECTYRPLTLGIACLYTATK